MAGKHSSNNFFEGLWQRLFRPHASLIEDGDIRRAQLIMALSLLIFVTCIVGALTSKAHTQGIVASIIMLVAMAAGGLTSYLLARSRYYRSGAFLLVWSFAISGFWLTINRRDDPTGALFSTIPIALIIGSVFLSVRGQVLLTSLCVLGTALLPRFFPEFTKMGRNSGLFLVMGGLLLISTAFRNALERVRLSELRASNTSLKQIQANLEERINERTAAAEADRLQAEAARLEADTARREVETQMWLATGQAQLAEKMRGEQNLEQLSNQVVTQLSQYLGAQAGALFILENNLLKLSGRYAYTERPAFSGQFKIGEGLVGQAAEEKQLVVSNLPDDALVVSTGLVEMLPRQMVVAPFETNGQVAGVLESAPV